MLAQRLEQAGSEIGEHAGDSGDVCVGGADGYCRIRSRRGIVPLTVTAMVVVSLVLPSTR
ncbi:hypothetical protein GCM10010206_65730 [Streptomyces cinerochromogenes]|nr:hypothetical protein GCM10010206_65730 [Streptomyces cinerochromogenes]